MDSSPAATAFERMAASLGGTCVTTDEAEPSVRFRWSGHELHLSIVDDPSGRRTGLVLKLAADPPFELDVYPQRALFNLVRRLVPLQDIVVGDAEFDRSFVVKGSDPERVIELFSAGVRTALLALAGLGEGGFATVYTTLKAVVVAVEGRVEELEKLETLAAHARTVFGAYLRVAGLESAT